METKNLQQVMGLVNKIAEYYDLPTEEETAYMMFHGEYPPVQKCDLVFWRYAPDCVLDDQAVYETYRLGKGTLETLEPLPLEEILKKIAEMFPEWHLNTKAGRKGRSWRFDAPEQAEYWTNTHFWIFEYGRETETEREHQILCFSCHNMDGRQIHAISECMESFQCHLHIWEENNF